MGLFNWVMEKLSTPIITTKFTDQSQNVDFKALVNKKLYFHDAEKIMIDKKFLDCDGYLTKLTLDNKVFGYLARCAYKNLKIKNKNGEEIIIPLFVTCVYQPKLENLTIEQTKLLAKDRSLKSGVRAIQHFIKESSFKPADNDYSLLNGIIGDFNLLFPSYSVLHGNPPLSTNNVLNTFFPDINNETDMEFLNLSEMNYSNIRSYMYSFDTKIERYYNNVDSKKIVKNWFKF